MSDPEISCAKEGRCGVIVLNRPDALNALTLPMVREIARALDAWEHDPAVQSVVVKAAGDRAFCAGADIRQLHDLGKAGRFDDQLAFWREEYVLNRRIKLYPKPYVSLVDGIVMGGGAGISIHGSHVVAGEKFSFAMPEVGIGFFPDVGATYFLPRLPGKAGVYIALTGARLTCGDAIAFGLASAHVPSARHEALAGRLIEGQDVSAAIAAEAAPAPESALAGQRHFIDGCFAAKTVAAILDEIDDAAYGGSEFAFATFETIRAKSPTSLTIALRQMQIGGSLDIDEALRTEFRIVARVARGEDFYEGVRAAIIDKDHSPAWRPAEIEAVQPADVDTYFAPLTAGELQVSAEIHAP
ncbi:enoyl-CoA hydratase/isomerase family protein [Methylocapsa acidiphila]|uniref:enoyl-CoA hydratase/isomerase family protein n=1 Tax=Methylocapsa acidiphila TaxID=133552 RepID=UPI0003F6174B|nr:enoyl-CoA hydratase/isomerase family protein [Methylocapsa acidiphila]